MTHLSKIVTGASLALSLLTGCGAQFDDPSDVGLKTTQRPSFVSNPATETKMMLGTRWHASSALEDIFGATTVVGTRSGQPYTVAMVTRDFLLKQVISWGGPCDPYADPYPVPKDVGWAIWPVQETTTLRGCSETQQSKSAIQPAGSSSRLAWTLRMCDVILSSDAAVRAMATSAGYPSGSSLNSPPSDAMIDQVYEIFHLGQVPPAAVKNGLKEVVLLAQFLYPNTPEAWRFLGVALCSSPSWQML